MKAEFPVKLEAHFNSFKSYFFKGIILMSLFIFAASCQRSVTRISPDTQIDLSGRWNDSDSRMVAEKMINDLFESERFKEYAKDNGKKPVLVVGLIKNKTSEHIDAANYIKKFEMAIYNSNFA